MTCTKTGCHIYIEPYDEYAYGDAFELEAILKNPAGEKLWRELSYNGWADGIRDIGLFRLTARSKRPINNCPVVHFIIHDYDQWFDQPDFEGSVIRVSTMFSNNYTSFGHDGKPIDAPTE